MVPIVLIVPKVLRTPQVRDCQWCRTFGTSGTGNLLILGLFGVGVSPGWLARRYDR